MRPSLRSVLDLIKTHVPDCRKGAEIGVWKGETSAAIMQAFPECHLWCVDLWKEWKKGTVYYDKHKDMGRYTQAEWDVIYQTALENLKTSGGKFTIRYHYSSENIDDIEDGTLDFVFLDANHMYKEVKEDILAWEPKVRDGGLIMGHDINGVWDRKGIWGITQATTEIFGKERVMTRRGHVWAVIQGENP